MIGPNGKKEVGYDTGGVLKDALTEFWSTFYLKCTEGIHDKVPCLRHDCNAVRCTGVAKVLWLGYKQVKYFPIEISPAFMKYCILGLADNVTIQESFFEVMAASDSATAKSALADFSAVDEDELTSMLSVYSCRKQINSSNFSTLLQEIAHKEIIQKPMFVLDCWSTILFGKMTEAELNDIYKNCQVCPKAVIRLLSPPQSIGEFTQGQ